MTVMLRDIGIPARLATGFQSGLYNPITELWLVRASDAHTWVEAWLPSRGWTTFDPTPPDPNPPGYGLLSRINLYLDAAQTFWQEWVVGYDAGQQGSLADRLEQTVRRLGLNWFDSAVVLGSDWNTRMASWGKAQRPGARRGSSRSDSACGRWDRRCCASSACGSASSACAAGRPVWRTPRSFISGCSRS